MVRRSRESHPEPRQELQRVVPVDGGEVLRGEYAAVFQSLHVITGGALALVTGQSTIDLSFNVMANLGWDEVRLPNPLFEGDTVYSRSEVLEKRESKSRPNVGIVKVRTTGFKQDGKIVIEFLRTFMVYKRGQVPLTAKARIPEPIK